MLSKNIPTLKCIGLSGLASGGAASGNGWKPPVRPPPSALGVLEFRVWGFKFYGLGSVGL